MQSLLNIVGTDMIAGIQTEKISGDKKIGDKVWCMMTEFKINVDQERATIKKDIRVIENQIAKLSDSIEILYDIKRKTETAKRYQKMSEEL